MIVGIGVDLVHIARIDSLLNRWGDRFLQRVFTKGEIQYCRFRKNPVPHFAVRFAAKEAFLKALGSGYSEGARWKDIEVVNHPSGQPALRLHHHARDLSQGRGVKRIHLSMTHDGTYGFVQVILEV